MSNNSPARQDTVLVWLLACGESEPPIAKEILLTIVHKVYVFNDPKECTDRLDTLWDEQVFVVLGVGRADTLNKLFDSPWILCIYLCELHPCSEAMPGYLGIGNVRGSFIDPSELFLQLVKDISVFPKNHSHLTFCPHDESSAQMLPENTARFLWSQLLLEQLLQVPRLTPAHLRYNDMLNECRVFYSNQEGAAIQIAQIDQFSIDYSPTNAIQYYTRDSFVYRVLNKALRTNNILVIYKFRFIIQDIYNQLENLRKEQQQIWNGRMLTVYRGQQLTAAEIAEWRQNQGNFVSMNSFLSTSESLVVASIYSSENLHSFLFEISIDTSLGDRLPPFAKIAHLSSIPDEEEVLVAMGATYRIEPFDMADNGPTRVRLTMCPRDDERLVNFKTIISNIGPILRSDQLNCQHESGVMLTIAYLLSKMKEHGKAQIIHQMAMARFKEEQRFDPIFESLSRHFSNMKDISRSSLDRSTMLNVMGKKLRDMIEPLRPVLDPDLDAICTNFEKFGEEELDVDNKDFSTLLHDAYENMDDLSRRIHNVCKRWCTGTNSDIFLNDLVLQALSMTNDQNRLNHHTIVQNRLETILGANNAYKRYRLIGQGLRACGSGDYDRALDFLLESVSLPESPVEDDLMLCAMARLAIVKILYNHDEKEGALEFANSIINMYKLPPHSTQLAKAYQWCARIYIEQRDFAKAIGCQRHLVNILSQQSSIDLTFDLEKERGLLSELQEKLRGTRLTRFIKFFRH